MVACFDAVRLFIFVPTLSFEDYNRILLYDWVLEDCSVCSFELGRQMRSPMQGLGAGPLITVVYL